MMNEKNTSPGRLAYPTEANARASHSTSVWSARGKNGASLLGSSTMLASAVHPTSSGLVLLKSMPLAQCAPMFGRLLRTLSFKPYAQTLELLRQHQNNLRRQERDPGLQLNLAWLSPINNSVEFNKRVLESFELSLAQTLFLETNHPQQSIDALCCESQFDAIVAEVPATPVILKRAQRWLKPDSHNPLKPEPAAMLENRPRERLFILIDERTGARR
jgi:hypothetical protein